MFLVHRDPKIFIVPNFVTPEEAEHLKSLAEEFWVPSTVGRGVYKTGNEDADLKNIQSNNRTSYSCMLKSAQTDIVVNIEHRLAALASLPVDNLERLNMVRYYPGQYFNEHHDGKFRPKTVFLYLNDLADAEGGETHFVDLGVLIRPSACCAVLWSNVDENGDEDLRMIHKGVAPLSGIKYGVNCFFNNRPVRMLEKAVVEMAAAENTQEARVEGEAGAATSETAEAS